MALKALSKPQIAALEYTARADYVATPCGSPSVTQRILAERGLCTISEVQGRPGFYATRITDAGRAALKSTAAQESQD